LPDAKPVGVALLRDPWHLLALGLGAGLVPRLPGTAGTLLGVVIYLPLQFLPWQSGAALIAALFLAGIPLCARTAARLGVPDHPAIVWDEVVGFLATMLAAPRGRPWIACGFLLFRLYDIWKPWPIRNVDRRVGGGLGIMLDDLLAAGCAAATMQIIAYLLKT
jgi:phosphatidylglycerophosphatase A